MIPQCDFCGKSTSRSRDTAGERLCVGCVHADHEQHASAQRMYLRWLQAVSAAVECARHNLPDGCEQRITRAWHIVIKNQLVVRDELAQVRSQSRDRTYTIDGICDCPDSRHGSRGAPRIRCGSRSVPACKHQIAVWLFKKASALVGAA